MRKINEPWEISQDKPPPTLAGAVQFLRNWISQKEAALEQGDTPEPMMQILARMMQEQPNDWNIGLHFGWGMAMRNLLRSNGYGEQELGIGNLDDYYAALIEEAVLGDGNNIRQYPSENKS